MPNSRVTLLILWLLLLALWPGHAGGWGFNVHHLINRAATDHLPSEFAAFAQWVDDLESLAIAADQRKCCVPGESIKHYIDIDDYPEFFTGTLPHTYSEMVAMYGQSRVDGNGTVPWAIEDNFNVLVQHFAAEDWTNAVAIAADIGHYAGDLHSPLHLTLNYNGQLTGQNGIHSRHETQMTNRHLNELEPSPATVGSLIDPLESVFDWIDVQYPGVDLILQADLTATDAAGGSTSSETYYDVLWQEVGTETTLWVRDASRAVAALWYTAWLTAGSPTLPGSQTSDPFVPASRFRLHPVRPNPFNPMAQIRFELAQAGPARVQVFDVQGRLVRVLFDGTRAAGEQQITWDGRDDAARDVASGVYIVRLEQAGRGVQRKAVLAR